MQIARLSKHPSGNKPTKKEELKDPRVNLTAWVIGIQTMTNTANFRTFVFGQKPEGNRKLLV